VITRDVRILIRKKPKRERERERDDDGDVSAITPRGML
jgi:hypothetical protein